MSAYYIIAWFDYWLKGDPEAIYRFTAPIDHLSPRFASRYNLGEGDVVIAGP